MHPLPRLLVVVAVLFGCGSGADDAGPTDGQRFPDVIGAEAEKAPDGTWTFAVTVSSPYDTPDRYADAWRILTTDGAELGVRELAHDHAAEQPFTRSLAGVAVPPAVTRVVVEARDLVHGWGGGRTTVSLAEQ